MDPEAFEWPDEKQKKRYARRQEMRARGEQVAEDAEFEAELKALEAEEAAADGVSGDVGEVKDDAVADEEVSIEQKAD